MDCHQKPWFQVQYLKNRCNYHYCHIHMLSIVKVSPSWAWKAIRELSPLTQGILLQIIWGTPFHELQSFLFSMEKQLTSVLNHSFYKNLPSKSNMACLPLFSTILANRDYIDHCTWRLQSKVRYLDFPVLIWQRMFIRTCFKLF